MRRRYSIWLSGSIVLFALLLASITAEAQDKPDISVFDEDDPIGAFYYDASVGLTNRGSFLFLAGPGRDKMSINTNESFSGTQSGLLQWRSVPAGFWELFIAPPGFATRDIRGYDAVSFYLNGPGAVSSNALPLVGLENSINIKTRTLDVGKFLPAGMDGDTSTWQKVVIPLSAFAPYPTQFSLGQFKDLFFTQGYPDDKTNTLWIDALKIVAANVVVNTNPPTAPVNIITREGDRSIVLHWAPNPEPNLAGYQVYRRVGLDGPFLKLTPAPINLAGFADLDVTNGQTYCYYLRALSAARVESTNSATVTAAPRTFADDNEFLNFVQQAAFDYFWFEANPTNGLVRDRSQPFSTASIAAVGFGLTAIGIGIDHGWITREAGADRVWRTLQTFWQSPQGTNSTRSIGYHGWFYHFLEMATGFRAGAAELSSVDTALFLAGALYAGEYFDQPAPAEAKIRLLASSIYDRVDWKWMANRELSLTLGWTPETGFFRSRWTGYNEAMILYLLALGAASNALPAQSWNSWTNGYIWQTHYGYSFLIFPPLFGHQYSHCWVDLRNLADSFMAGKASTYFENSRRATLAQRAYAIANPHGFPGYSSNLWGLTACDGPGSEGFYSYIARGAAPSIFDDGTIAPTAVAGSMPFTPELSLRALRYFYDNYRSNIWTAYGFRDAFNLKANWWGPDVIGIDQGPIIIMLENARSESVWKRFMRLSQIQRGLEAAGFVPVSSASVVSPK